LSVGCSSGLEFHGRATGRLALVKKLGLTRFLDSAVLFLPSANPKVACYGTISTPTRRAPAATDPRLFAVGDSHRSQGFLYPWKPYAPPHIPVYSRFVPPPQAAEQTGKRPNRSEHRRCLCRLRRQRHRGNGIWRGHEAWGKETPGYGADRLRRKRAGGGGLNAPPPASLAALLHRARSSSDQRHNPTRHLRPRG